MSEFQQQFKLLQPSRGGYKLAENGFLYDKQRKVEEVIHWQCEQRTICVARIFTKDLEIVRRSNDHMHGVDENRISCYETKTQIKRKAELTQDSTHQIVGNSLLSVSEGIVVKLPKLDSLNRTIQRQRQRVLAAPSQPLNLLELEELVYKRHTFKKQNWQFVSGCCQLWLLQHLVRFLTCFHL